ncbi:MAG: hypothetical protein D6702_11565 [Planctomycetota bacterium]|nr:MAG: hypothetical protein D6702_11565 [Planctomycetota bacterium]
MITLLVCALLQGGGEELVLAADRLHDGTGRVLAPAVVVVADGRIRSVTSGEAPAGALHVEGAELTPGLIDAYSYMGVGGAALEESRESTPAMKVAATCDLDAPAFRHAVEEGVTAAYLSPDSFNVIAGLGALVKTAGGDPADLFAPAGSAARVVEDAAALKIVLGNDASLGNYSPGRWSDVKGRRPTTRMGVTWEIRRQFYRALAWREARAAGRAGDDPDLAVLIDALEGRIPIRVQARRAHDVQTALRLQQEFGWPRMILEEGTEAHQVAGLLAAAGVPVAAGPAYDSLGRAIVSSPTVDELEAAVHPEPVCCEHLHEEGYDERAETGLLPLEGPVLAATLRLIPADEAAGLVRGRRSEGDHATPAGIGLLRRAGVEVVFGAAEAHDGPATEASVIHQARTAVAWGLDPAEALPMCTARAAALLGADDRIGTIEAGKDADLVLWSGPPLAAESRPLLVLVDGRVVLDRLSDR